MEKINMSAPWLTYFREIEALFKQDPEVTIKFSGDPPRMVIYVENAIKADAISKLLPSEKNFGKVVATIKVIPANEKETKAVLIQRALDGNPIFNRMVSAEGIFINPIHFCVFKKEVAQFWDDNLGDINGNISILYEDIAEDIFEDTEGILFCTDED